MLTKICIECGTEKPATNEYFGAHKTCKDGLRNQCKECKNKYSKKYNPKYYENNKEKTKEQAKEYRNNNKEKVKESKNKYRLTHLEEERMSKRIYLINNRDKVNLCHQKRKAKKRKLPRNLTVEQWEKIKSDFNNSCAYCGSKLPLAQEHFIPLSKGGEYTVNNIIPSCQSCNSSKRDKSFFEWYKNYEFYSKEREEFILKYLGYKEEIQQLRVI